MLKSRSLIILAAVLALLVAISLVQSIGHKRATSRSNTTSVLGMTFDPENLSRLEVGYGQVKDALVLENLPDGWVVRTAFHHQANQQRVDDLLQNLNELEGEFRSDSEEVLADYGFTDSTVVTIVGFGDGEELVFGLEIGKKPDRAVGNFARQPGSNKVFLTNKSILSNLGLYSGPDLPQNKHFLNLEAFKCEKNDVDALTLVDSGATVKMHKVFKETPGDTTGHTGTAANEDPPSATPVIDRNVFEWKMTEPVEMIALKTKADGVLGAICNIRGVDIADPTADAAQYGLNEPQKQAVIQMQDGIEHVIYIGDKREAEDDKPAGFYLRVGQAPTVWVVADYQSNNIFKSHEELLPEDS